MEDDPYIRLANAIVIQAAKDYRKAKKQLERNSEYEPAKEMLEDTVRFFRSEWFSDISGLDSEYILERLARA